MRHLSNNLIGALCALGAAIAFSLNDVGIKFLSGDFPLHEVVFIRTLIGMALFLVVLMPLNGGLSLMRTNRLGANLLRGLCAVTANLMFFLGLSAMPIADAVAIFFVSPLIITIFSVIFLGEYVGPRRWSAVVLGLIGVMIVIRPGTDAFQIASLLPLIAAVGYGFLHIITRQIRATESAATLTFYTLITFLLSSALIGLLLGHGRYDGYGHPALGFLLREWSMPATPDFPVFLLIGCASVAGGMLISEAYRKSDAAFVAPFEYISLPLAIFWGVTVFDEFPDLIAISGMVLIIGSGLYMVWREAQINKRKDAT